MTFRAMRRGAQQLPPEECEAILREGSAGVLAVLGDGGWPYTVPMSYVWHNGCVYFHCARAGHKLDAVRACEKVSFCVVAQDRVVPEEYTTYYRSVVVFATAEEVTDPDESRAALAALADKYHPTGAPEDRDRSINRQFPALTVLRLTPVHITGKQARELMRKRGTPGSP